MPLVHRTRVTPVKRMDRPERDGALVLSRRIGERIVMRDANGLKITVGIGDIHNGKIRLAIVAPASVIVHREEIDREIHPEDYGS